MHADPTLRLASDDERSSRDRLTAGVWGGGLSLEQFCRREQVLRGHPWTTAVMKSWWWARGGLALASCETFELPGSVAGRRGTSRLIASVYTEPALRGAGHASAMLRALAEDSRAAGCQALVLFSEVGVALYGRLGFIPMPAFDVVLPARRSSRGVLPPCNQPERSFVEGSEVLALDRTKGHLDWQLERERFYAQTLGRPRPTTASACSGAASIGWTAYYKTDELQVLWLDADEGTRGPLLEAAQHAAWEAGLKQVRVWDTGRGEWAARASEAVVMSRDDEVPMFLPLTEQIARWQPIERGMWA